MKYEFTKRLFDVFLSIFSLIIFSIPIFIISLIVAATSHGPILYWSIRIGRKGSSFMMPKFRTMQIDAPTVPTHLLVNSKKYLTPVGSLLRKTSLDELPQLWSILIGDMSFVGPRPALFNQLDLISLRSKYGVDDLVPGLTGWAQVNGRDEISISLKVHYEVEYFKRQSFWFDMKIIVLTFFKVLRRSGVSH
jgi:O-antigen biosynthesis protein WbqP